MSALLARLSAMMFLQFFIWGCWLPLLFTFVTEEKKWDVGIVGSVFTNQAIAAVVAPVFLGVIADRFFATQRVLGVMHLLGGAFLMLIPGAVESNDTELFNTLFLAHLLCYMPTLGLTNTLAFHKLENREKQFPVVRVFGTLGWIAAGLTIGWLGFDRDPVLFQICGGLSIAFGVFSFTLPHVDPPLRGTKVSIGSTLGLDALVLLKKPSFAVFMVCSFLICIPLAFYYNAAGGLVTEVGYENPGVTLANGQVAEVVFMLLMPWFFAKLGVRWMLAIGMGAWVVRYGLFAAAADDQIKWMVIAGILLHGICYDFFFVTGQIYVDRVAGERIRGQAQALLVVATQGLGLGIGAELATRSVKSSTTTPEGSDVAVTDWATVWTMPALGALAVLVIFLLTFRGRNDENPEAAAA